MDAGDQFDAVAELIRGKTLVHIGLEAERAEEPVWMLWVVKSYIAVPVGDRNLVVHSVALSRC